MREKATACDCIAVHQDTVDKVRAGMLSTPEVHALSGLFKILGDPTRIRIMWALEQSELCVCDLTATLDMTKSAISHQLNTLRQARLVKFRREGKNVFYSLDDQHVNSIIEMARTHLQHS